MGVKAHMDPCFTLISGWLMDVPVQPTSINLLRSISSFRQNSVSLLHLYSIARKQHLNVFSKLWVLYTYWMIELSHRTCGTYILMQHSVDLIIKIVMALCTFYSIPTIYVNLIKLFVACLI
jgi:hypothetical protein